MNFLDQMQKVAKCSGCGNEFLMLGDMTDGEAYYCSADCIEKGYAKKR